jgi:hypothetical protein
MRTLNNQESPAHPTYIYKFSPRKASPSLTGALGTFQIHEGTSNSLQQQYLLVNSKFSDGVNF